MVAGLQVSGQEEVPDVAIVGSGPSGLSLAGILEQYGISYVVYENYTRDDVPQGGCLDMHAGSGHEAFRRAGCYLEFRKYARGGPATIHQVWDSNGNLPFAWGEGKDSPEMDRFDIKRALLTVVPDQKIRWQCGVDKAERDENGNIVLYLGDGRIATGFKLVVGADGTWSKVRHLITSTRPEYSGIVNLTAHVTHDNPLYPQIERMAKQGPMVVMGRGLNIWCQRQGAGHYRCDLGLVRSLDWAKSLDLDDTELLTDFMLSDEFFGHHCSDVKKLIGALEGPFRVWPMWFMPPDALNWTASSDVTLIGDAAHTVLCSST